MTIYRYGLLAWVWRPMAALGIVAGVGALVVAVRTGEWWMVLVALPLLAPSLVLPPMIAMRIDTRADGSLEVRTLAFTRRRVQRSALRAPKIRTSAAGTFMPVYAPRAWVSVEGGLPIYLDLFAAIPDREAFLDVFPGLKQALPRGD